jgi:hypothetical protein
MHLLFVDDILLFGRGTLWELKSFKNIIDTFFISIGLEVNMSKSCLLYNEMSEKLKRIPYYSR